MFFIDSISLLNLLKFYIFQLLSHMEYSYNNLFNMLVTNYIRSQFWMFLSLFLGVSSLWVIFFCSLVCLVIFSYKSDIVTFTLWGALIHYVFLRFFPSPGKLLKTLWTFQSILLKFIIWNQINLGLIFLTIEAIPHYWGNTQWMANKI